MIHMNSKEKVIKAFKESEEPLNATKVSQISGVDKKEVSKIMNELKRDETIYSPKRCYWALKK
jgi:predicted Zn-ribbon and HTH transcriptional regulator